MDWIKVYAEARVTFPVDVWLRTTEDHGAVVITASRREWCPPLPAGFVPAPGRREVLLAHPDRTATRHELCEYALRYAVHDIEELPWITQEAAWRWLYEAEDRARPYLDPASLVPLVREQLGGFGFAAMIPEPAILSALARSENHVAPAAYELASRATQYGYGL